MKFKLRLNTSDLDIYTRVYRNNEYSLTEFFNDEDIIIDIGGHVGSFSKLVIDRGCKNLYSYEADEATYKLLKENLDNRGEKIYCFNSAVWRSDVEVPYLFYSGYSYNPAGGSVICSNTNIKVNVKKFDDIISEISTNSSKRIKLLKLDCEGSEYAILYTSKLLHLVDLIYLEYHNLVNIPEATKVSGFSKYNGEELLSYLETLGYKIIYNNLAHIHEGMQLGLAKLELSNK